MLLDIQKSLVDNTLIHLNSRNFIFNTIDTLWTMQGEKKLTAVEMSFKSFTYFSNSSLHKQILWAKFSKYHASMFLV